MKKSVSKARRSSGSALQEGTTGNAKMQSHSSEYKKKAPLSLTSRQFFDFSSLTPMVLITIKKTHSSQALFNQTQLLCIHLRKFCEVVAFGEERDAGVEEAVSKAGFGYYPR